MRFTEQFIAAFFGGSLGMAVLLYVAWVAQ